METLNLHIEPYELIAAYLANETTPNESLMLENWIKESDANRKLFDEYVSTWNAIDAVNVQSKINVDEEWKLFEAKISTNTEAKIVDLNPANKTTYKSFMKVAAILIVAVCIGSFIFYLNKPPRTVQLATVKEQKTMQLADGSEITLNNNTVLDYPKSFKGNKRNVRLKGEAFFNVSHDKDKPFIIQTNKIVVEVVGTSFNVKAYDNSDSVEVSVKTGKVKVSSVDDNTKLVYLMPGEKGLYLKSTKSLTKLPIANNNDIAWKTRKLVFKNQLLSEVIKTLNETYYSKIVLKDNTLTNCRLTVSFDNQSLGAVLKVIEATLDVNVVKKESNLLIISGKGCN